MRRSVKVRPTTSGKLLIPIQVKCAVDLSLFLYTVLHSSETSSRGCYGCAFANRASEQMREGGRVGHCNGDPMREGGIKGRKMTVNGIQVRVFELQSKLKNHSYFFFSCRLNSTSITGIAVVFSVLLPPPASALSMVRGSVLAT